jgi:hypothetical protein
MRLSHIRLAYSAMVVAIMNIAIQCQPVPLGTVKPIVITPTRIEYPTQPTQPQPTPRQSLPTLELSPFNTYVTTTPPTK